MSVALRIWPNSSDVRIPTFGLVLIASAPLGIDKLTSSVGCWNLSLVDILGLIRQYCLRRRGALAKAPPGAQDVGVQLVVPQELKERAVKFIGPDFVTIFTTPPVNLANSVLKALVTTENSSTASGFGMLFPVLRSPVMLLPPSR